MYKDKEYLYEQFIVKRLKVKVIAENNNVSKSTIENWLKKYNLKRGNNTYTIDEKRLYETHHPIFSYYAGLVTTDGHLSKVGSRVALRVRNQGSYEVLNTIKDFLGYTGEVKTFKGLDNELAISNKKLRDKLICYGISEKGKSYNYFPRILDFLPNPTEHKKMFYRGILDGDGNIKNKGTFRVTMGNKGFLEGFIESINKTLDLDVQLFKDRDYWKIEMTKQQSKTFLDFVYEGYEDLRFPNKYENYKRVKI